jgi:perosamine synthetase
LSETAETILIAQPTIGEEELAALRGPIETGWLTQGPRVVEFERLFAERHGVRHAIATTSCTTALHLALAALRIGPGDEVIVPAFTWVATANVCRHVGATPVFVDVEPASYNLDPTLVTAAVTERTRAIIPVHLFGRCADMERLRQALPEDIAIVEDAACAVGAHDGTGPAGTLGDVGCFSFHPRKIITTGEGGMATTNNDALAARLRELRNHGAAIPEEVRHKSAKPHQYPDFNEVGFNFRMTDLQGAIGAVQMRKLDSLLEERARWADWYRARLARLGWLRQPSPPPRGVHSYQAFVCTVDETTAPMDRDAIMDRLNEQGIATRPGTHAPPFLGCYVDQGKYTVTDFPVSAWLADATLTLPLHNRMSERDYEKVARALESL